MKKILAVSLALCVAYCSFAQKYQNGLVDRSIAVIGNELISLSDLENEVQLAQLQGGDMGSNPRCTVLETMMQAKLFLMQARLDSLNVNQENVSAEVTDRIARTRTALGGDEGVEEYFGKPLYKLRAEWMKQMEELSLTQQEQQEIAKKLPEVTPYDVKQYLDTASVNRLPIIPKKYQYSQICVYPNRDSAATACREKLLLIRQRILNGERFSTLARLYSEDPGSARKGGELGMASHSIFWPAFGDMGMSLKLGTISQIIETPDGFHIMEVIDRKGDMFNARHILLKPRYSDEDRVEAYKKLDSLKAQITRDDISFELAARIYSEDPATRTNGGQVANPMTGSSYYDIDQIKPQDYRALQNLEVGQMSDPITSVDDEGNEGHLVYKILRLDKIIPAHTATAEKDYTELLGIIEGVKRTEAVKEFVKKKIGETYIVIDPLFEECNFSMPEWSSKIAKHQ